MANCERIGVVELVWSKVRAIKGAAEYEFLLLEAYPQLRENPGTQEALRRMGPQLLAHLVLIGLIVVGNVVYFVGRSRGEA